MFYLTTHSTHFIYSYMASDSDSKKGNPLLPHRLLFPISSKGLLYASAHRQDSIYHGLCYTSRGALAQGSESGGTLISHTDYKNNFIANDETNTAPLHVLSRMFD